MVSYPILLLGQNTVLRDVKREVVLLFLVDMKQRKTMPGL